MPKSFHRPISKLFVLFIIAIAALAVYYLMIPREKAQQKGYEELLETNKEAVLTPGSSNVYEKKQVKKINTVKNNYNYNITKSVNTNNYNEILDEIKSHQVNSDYDLKNIVNKLIVYKGYKPNTVNVILTDINQNKSKTAGSYLAANFDFKTGNLYVSKELIKTVDKKVIIAILVHELDHFDKLAKVCKYMGVENFKELFNLNRVPDINTVFWTKASDTANIKDFNCEYYKTALERFLTQNDLELLSSYSNFYRLAENMRNPLEISAYAASDYVYEYYNIKIEAGPMRKLTQKFNDVDWAVYNTIKTDNLLEKERIPAFDYFFMKAIIKKFPDLKSQFDICAKQKDGDLTSFWLDFETRFKGFYGKNQMDEKTFDEMYTVLSYTEDFAKKGFTKEEAADALKYKTNTILSNLVYPKAAENLKKACYSYLNYIKANNITDNKEELKCILTILCLENKLYKNNSKEISLYYINIPQELLYLYNISNKKQFLLFLYQNEYFKSQCKNYSESQFLSKMLDESRLDIKVKD